MNEEELLKKLREAFGAEAQERLASLSSSLLDLEKGAGEEAKAQALEVAFREAHSLQLGVSTSPIITEISGRGLGLAIVQEKVEKLGGAFIPGHGFGRGDLFQDGTPRDHRHFQGHPGPGGRQAFHCAQRQHGSVTEDPRG